MDVRVPPLKSNHSRVPPSALALALALTLAPTPSTLHAAPGVVLRELPGQDARVRIEINGELFAEYVYRGASRPSLYPVLAPGGSPVTRRWPFQDTTNEDKDHPHQRSLWHSHGDINGVDFWSESSQAGRTVHVEFLELTSSRNVGVLKSLNHLVARDGTRIGTTIHTLRFHPRPDTRLFDYDVTFVATDGDLKFGDTKEGTMAIRLAETMRLKPNKFNAGKPTGTIVNSEGLRNGDTWGKRAAWVDYYGPVDGQILGVALFDHPTNPRHPTWWHVRDYGLFAANPFGIHDFERKPPGTGNLTVPANSQLTFRYRFLIHRGNEIEGEVNRFYQEYAAPAQP
jgi:hypothetical protein